MIAYLLKCVSDFTASSKKGLFSRTGLLKKTPWKAKVLVFAVWNNISNIWDTLSGLIPTEVQCRKSHFKFFVPLEAGASGNNVENKSQKVPPKLKIYFFQNYAENIFYGCNPVQEAFFCKHVLIL